MASEEKIRTQFGLRASTFEKSAHWVTDEKLAAAHVAAAGKPGKGIDLCCGTGVVGRALLKGGWDVTGVDVTPEMVAEASRSIPAIRSNAEKLPLGDASLDLVVMRQAYFLLPDGPAVLREVRRVLKPSGRFVLSQTVPFSEVDREWLRKVHETKQRAMVRFFTAEDLRRELETHGFEVTDEKRLAVRESVSLWMDQAPELDRATREEVCRLVVEAPESYRKLRNVKVVDGEILEDWNWVVLTGRKK